MADATAKVTKDMVKATIEDAEAAQTFTKRTALYKYVGDLLGVSPSTIASFVRFNEIPLKTEAAPLARQGMSIKNTLTPDTLGKAVAEAEAATTFESKIALNKHLGMQFNTSAATIAALIKSYGIKVQTANGKRGRRASGDGAAKSPSGFRRIDVSEFLKRGIEVKTVLDLVKPRNKGDKEKLQAAWDVLKGRVAPATENTETPAGEAVASS